MDLNKYHTFIENFLHPNLNIDISLIKFTRFIDDEIETKFQKDREIKDRYQKILADIILILGFVASIIYIIFAFYKVLFLVICLICFLIDITLIICSYFTKNRKLIYIINNLEILLIVLSLNIKGNLLNFYYNTPDEDNHSELLRVIIYDFVSSNLFSLLKLEANIFVNSFFFTLNMFLIITSSIYSNKNRFYFLEGIISFLFTLVFFALRKAWDYRIRLIFAEKYKFERLYKYTIDFIKGLNAYHVNIRNNEIVYYDEKLKSLLENFSENNEEFKNLDFEDENKSKGKEHRNDVTIDQNLSNKDLSNKNILEIEKNSLIKSYNNNDLINFHKNNFFKFFLKYLFLYKDENEEKTYNNSKGLFANSDDFKKESLFSHLKKIRTVKIACEKIEEEKINLISKDKSEKNLCTYENTTIKKDNVNPCRNIVNIKVEDKDENKNISKQLINNEKESVNNFIHLGIYRFKNPEIKKYFDVYYRRISIEDLDVIYDLLFYDISELINSKKIIYEENIIKQKVLAKIAHEFKTPINSIIGLINNLKESCLGDNDVEDRIKTEIDNESLESSINNDIQNFDNRIEKSNKSSEIKVFSKNLNINQSKNLKILNTIQNLSKYIIFLVSDIIQFSTIKDVNEIHINNEKISLREIANFSLEILRCLLSCNISKHKNIKTILNFQDELDSVKIKIDEIRLKQIMLNIISNAVKFTKSGFIKITFKLKNDTNEVKIVIEDTGIGIKDSDKEKLFNDFVMLGDGFKLNNQGSGLGLSICKSLAYKMKLRLNFKSKYCDGTKFYITIPIKSNLNKSCIDLCGYFNILNKDKELDPIRKYRETTKPNSSTFKELCLRNQLKIEKVILSNYQIVLIHNLPKQSYLKLILYI